MDREMWRKIKMNLLFSCGDIAYISSGRIAYTLGIPRPVAFREIAFRIASRVVMREIFSNHPESILDIGLKVAKVIQIKREVIGRQIAEYIVELSPPFKLNTTIPGGIVQTMLGDIFKPQTQLAKGLLTLLSLHGDSLFEASKINPEIMASRIDFGKANLFSASALSMLSPETSLNPYLFQTLRELTVNILGPQIATYIYLSPFEIDSHAKMIGEHLRNIWRSLKIF